MEEPPPPIEPDEIVLRRVPLVAGACDLSLPQPISRGAFKPSERDLDGLSFYRERFVSPLAKSRPMVNMVNRPPRPRRMVRTRVLR